MADAAVSSEDGVDDLVATDGRVIGRRAMQTRRRILDVTAALLHENGALDLKVIDVARDVGVSPATFYQYFADVEHAILAMAAELVTEVRTVSAMLELDLTGADGLDRAREFVSAYTRFWDDHAAVLRIMMLRADERDERFRQVRREYNEQFMTAMVAKVLQAQSVGAISTAINAEAAAGAMLAALDRLPNYRQRFEKRGTSREAMVETVARLTHTALTGHSLA